MVEQHRGFTLFDALVALAMLAIVVGVGVPSMQHFLIENRLTLTANELVGHLRLARSEAIWRNQRVVLCPRQRTKDECANNWAQGWMLFVDSNDNLKRDVDEQVVRIYGPLTANISLASAGRRQIVFQTHGRTPGSNATFTFCHLGSVSARQIILSASGRTRAENNPAACKA